jgi:Tol biopolymer transport system component
MATAPPVPVLTGLQTGESFSLSADGRRLLYARVLRYSHLWLVTLDRAGREVSKRRLTTGTSMRWWPSVSPDGKRIALGVGHKPRTNVFTMPIEGGPLEQVTSFQAFSSDPVWSADGTRLAFVSNEGGAFRVWTVDARGGAARVFERSTPDRGTGDYDATPVVSWTPGRDILYQHSSHRNFSVLDPVTGRERLLIPNDSVGYAFAPQVSPDGTKVALAWNRTTGAAARGAASLYVRGGVWVISLPDGSETPVRKDDWAMPIGWSDDGRWIYAFRDNLILRLTADGRSEETLVTFDKPVAWASATLDRRRFVVMLREEQSDVWLAENFDPDVP